MTKQQAYLPVTTHPLGYNHLIAAVLPTFEKKCQLAVDGQVPYTLYLAAERVFENLYVLDNCCWTIAMLSALESIGTTSFDNYILETSEDGHLIDINSYLDEQLAYEFLLRITLYEVFKSYTSQVEESIWLQRMVLDKYPVLAVHFPCLFNSEDLTALRKGFPEIAFTINSLYDSPFAKTLAFYEWAQSAALQHHTLGLGDLFENQ